MTFQTIITASNLVKNLYNNNWLILDCRGGVLYEKKKYEKFLENHIPNAFYYCFSAHSLNDSELKSTSSCCSIITKPAQIIENLIEYGFDDTTQIILYDDSSSSFTDNMWLMLRSAGCKHVAVLQGGIAIWKEQKYPLANIEDSNKKKNPLVNFDKILRHTSLYTQTIQ